MKKIGYMGIEGSFSETAAKELAELMMIRDPKFVPMVNAQNISEALLNDDISYGVLAVRNTTVGPVEEFIQAFGDTAYEVQGMYTLPIHHCLFKKPEVSVDDLTEVTSHPQALAQTTKTRADKYPALKDVVYEDTALAAQALAEGNLPDTTAVICSSNAGKLWNLELIEENIEDASDNQTIFWLITI
jgi:prephenate dehydratase